MKTFAQDAQGDILGEARSPPPCVCAGSPGTCWRGREAPRCRPAEPLGDHPERRCGSAQHPHPGRHSEPPPRFVAQPHAVIPCRLWATPMHFFNVFFKHARTILSIFCFFFYLVVCFLGRGEWNVFNKTSLPENLQQSPTKCLRWAASSYALNYFLLPIKSFTVWFDFKSKDCKRGLCQSSRQQAFSAKGF